MYPKGRYLKMLIVALFLIFSKMGFGDENSKINRGMTGKDVRFIMGEDIEFLFLVLCCSFWLSHNVQAQQPAKTIYNFTMKTIDGKDRSLADFKGKTVLVVNTASRCGHTPQYRSLSRRYTNSIKTGALWCSPFLRIILRTRSLAQTKKLRNSVTLNIMSPFRSFQK